MIISSVNGQPCAECRYVDVSVAPKLCSFGAMFSCDSAHSWPFTELNRTLRNRTLRSVIPFIDITLNLYPDVNTSHDKEFVIFKNAMTLVFLHSFGNICVHIFGLICFCMDWSWSLRINVLKQIGLWLFPPQRIW